MLPSRGKLLAVRLRSLGDAVLMTPLLAAIRSERPHLELSVVLQEPAASLLGAHPLVDKVFPLGDGLLTRLRTLREIRDARFDIALDLHGGPTAALLTRASRAKTRIGLDSYRSHRAYDIRLPAPFKRAAREDGIHTVTSNLALARSLGLTPSDLITPSLQHTPGGEDEAERALRRAGWRGAPFVAIHPGAALRSKMWPIERFLEVARLIRDRLRIDVVLLQPPEGSDRHARTEVLSLEPVSVVGLLSVLGRASSLVCNDSGPAHMAAAIGVPTVAIFGSQNPRVWRPWGDKQGSARHRALWAGLSCSPCRGFTCDQSPAFGCLDAIGVEQVYAAVTEVLGARSRERVSD